MLSSLFRTALPLTLQPKDEEAGVAAALTPAELCSAYEGSTALVVGGTRGIGKSIASTLSAAGAAVVVVGRSAAPPGGVAADLSTAAGCKALVDELSTAGSSSGLVARNGFSFVVLTAGVWPDPSSPYTADGVDKVIAIDLLARHVLLTRLSAAGLLAAKCSVMAVLASGQWLPGPVVGDAEAIKERLAAAVLPRPLPTPPPSGSVATGMRLMLTAAVAHDVWLMGMGGRLPDGVTLLSTFPGLLVSDLMASTFPSWVVPLLQGAMAPLADSAETMGANHAAVLAAATSRRAGRATYWAAPLLEARRPHPLAEDAALGAWLLEWLDGLAEAA